MPYRPNLDDVSHLLFNVLGAPARVAEVPRHAEVDETLMRDVLLGAAVFVQERIAPLSRQGDEVGARWKDGQVTMPPGFVQAYQEFWQGGWPALACAPDDGGQGLPAVLDNVLYEWLAAANHGFTMAPGLLHGAYECLKHHGSEALKSRYLDKIASGEWLATMALTEPQAGSDLGLVRTRAGSMISPRTSSIWCSRARWAPPRGPRVCRCSWRPRFFPTAAATPSAASASKKRWACTAARPACCALMRQSAGPWAPAAKA
jgi:hypothetical protein